MTRSALQMALTPRGGSPGSSSPPGRSTSDSGPSYDAQSRSPSGLQEREDHVAAPFPQGKEQGAGGRLGADGHVGGDGARHLRRRVLQDGVAQGAARGGPVRFGHLAAASQEGRPELLFPGGKLRGNSRVTNHAVPTIFQLAS